MTIQITPVAGRSYRFRDDETIDVILDPEGQTFTPRKVGDVRPGDLILVPKVGRVPYTQKDMRDALRNGDEQYRIYESVVFTNPTGNSTRLSDLLFQFMQEKRPELFASNKWDSEQKKALLEEIKKYVLDNHTVAPNDITVLNWVKGYTIAEKRTPEKGEVRAVMCPSREHLNFLVGISPVFAELAGERFQTAVHYLRGSHSAEGEFFCREANVTPQNYSSNGGSWGESLAKAKGILAKKYGYMIGELQAVPVDSVAQVKGKGSDRLPKIPGDYKGVTLNDLAKKYFDSLFQLSARVGCFIVSTANSSGIKSQDKSLDWCIAAYSNAFMECMVAYARFMHGILPGDFYFDTAEKVFRFAGNNPSDEGLLKILIEHYERGILDNAEWGKLINNADPQYACLSTSGLVDLVHRSFGNLPKRFVECLRVQNLYWSAVLAEKHIADKAHVNPEFRATLESSQDLLVRWKRLSDDLKIEYGLSVSNTEIPFKLLGAFSNNLTIVLGNKWHNQFSYAQTAPQFMSEYAKIKGWLNSRV